MSNKYTLLFLSFLAMPLTAYDLKNEAFLASISREVPYATGFVRYPALIPVFFDAIATGTLDDVKNVINQGVTVKAKRNGKTAMDMVIERNKNNASDPEVITIAEFLLDKGADVDSTRNVDTPLVHAVKQGSYELVKLLLDRGAALNVTDSQTGLALPFMLDQIDNAAIVDLLSNALEQAYDKYCGKTCQALG